jgi:hypothetical protein
VANQQHILCLLQAHWHEADADPGSTKGLYSTNRQLGMLLKQRMDSCTADACEPSNNRTFATYHLSAVQE